MGINNKKECGITWRRSEFERKQIENDEGLGVR